MTDRDRLAEAFDAYAVDFDETVGDSEVVRRLRRRIYARVRSRLPAGGSILDINCGTGTDCLALQAMGYETTGIDVSAAMIDRARAKASGRSRFEVLPFERVGELGDGRFDLVLSNNSGLNCALDLKDVLEGVHRVLRPDGWLVMVVMPPFSLWETVAGLARADTAYAFRRRHLRTANVAGHSVPIRYWGVSAVRAAAVPGFEVARLRGLNVLAPSPNSHTFARMSPKITRLLEPIDRFIGTIPVVRSWGDQILLELRRIGAPIPHASGFREGSVSASG